MKSKKQKRYQDMTAAELAEATKEYDKPFTFERARPMNRAERAAARVFRHPGGRPRVGAGAARINVTIERRLLAQADAQAKRERIPRSELIARGLALALQKAS